MNESQQGEAISFLHKKFANINIVLHQLKKIVWKEVKCEKLIERKLIFIKIS